MANVPLYISYARIAQYEEENKNRKDRVFKGGALVPPYSRLLYILQTQIAKRYALAPTDSTLNATAEYMFSLTGARTINTTPVATPFIIVIQPQSQTITSGTNVSFSVSVAGGVPAYTYQWYFNNVAIGGATSATYSITPATGANTGQYKVIIHDANGQTLTSVNALLTVTIPTINVYAVPLASDPFPLTVDSYTYTYHMLVNATGNIPWTLLNADNDVNWWIFKEDISATLKLSYDNGTNLPAAGVIPDSVIRTAITLGSFRYYLTRIQLAYDPTQDFTLKTTP
jgi:hypothetical protein